jgi:hypothetical protein
LSAILLGFSERFPTSGNDINVALLIAALVNNKIFTVSEEIKALAGNVMYYPFA